jgi:CRP/FNR family transcriptional regulator, cyclic AMP receptor protein
MLDPLRERGRTVTFEAGEALMHEGELGDKVALILSGRVKVSHAGPDGHETVLDFRGPGELVGELSALDQAPRSSSVTAIEQVEALLVSARDFRRLLDRPEFAVELLRRMGQRFRDADRKRVEFGASDTVGRVAARLVELAERYGEPEGRSLAIALPLNQEELAGWAAASRAAMANALQTLRELGWIETGRRRIRVLDLEALRRRSVQN